MKIDNFLIPNSEQILKNEKKKMMKINSKILLLNLKKLKKK